MVDVPDSLLLHRSDDVAVLLRAVEPGEAVSAAGTVLHATRAIQSGHKIAIRAIAEGQRVRKFGQVIGYATRPIAPGEPVHVWNLGMGPSAAEHHVGAEYRPVASRSSRTFDGILRPDGRVPPGTTSACCRA